MEDERNLATIENWRTAVAEVEERIGGRFARSEAQQQAMSLHYAPGVKQIAVLHVRME